jgi:hypothetical protein
MVQNQERDSYIHQEKRNIKQCKNTVVEPAGRPARLRTQHDYHHDTKVKPEAVTAVIELLMKGGKTPETY